LSVISSVSAHLQRIARVDVRYGLTGLSLLLALLAWGSVNLWSPTWLHALEERAGDWVWRATASSSDERRLIIIDVDERSLSEIGPWPWPRATQAQLIQVLADAGVRQQVFDVVFSDTRPDDSVFLKAIQKHHPVLAQVFALEQGGTPSTGQPTGALDWTTCPAPFTQAKGFIANQPLFATPPDNPPGQTTYAGHITPRIADDGVVRHQPAIICWADQSYPSLSLAAIMQGSAEKTLKLQRGNWFEAPWHLTGGNQTIAKIPLDDRGDIRISWRLQPDSFISISAADLLSGRARNSLPPDLLTGAWVLIGSSAFGLNDTIATPFGGANAGMQAHAQMIAALIDGRTPYTPRAAPVGQLLAALLGIALLFRLSKVTPGSKRFPIQFLPIAAFAWCLLTWLAHATLLINAAIWIGWLAPALVVLLTGLFTSILFHAKSRVDRDRLYTHLSSYLPAPVAASLALQSPSGAIKASTVQVSVLFADIRNFSAYCEARPPEEAAAVLHAFFSVATRVVEAQGGVIEAFQGDAVIAVWNATHDSRPPLDTEVTHAQHALQAAINLQAAMQDVLPDPAPAGLEPLSLGIGVETGPAMAGSFGLASRRTHMVMGRTVTIASRLVDMTADLAHPILVGEGLAGQIGGAGLQSMGTFLLDGMRVPHHVYAYPLDRALRIY
jgi:adenylate cyclase